ncbi:hypothetical protein IJD15_00990 [bacterium]|nr:hypothetical protein [bacterium]
MQVNFVNNFSNKANPSFSGYKNIVSNTVTEDFCRISYMAMELNNDKTNDLDKWIEIQKKLLKIENPSKHLIITTSLRPPNGRSFETRACEAIGPNEFVLNLNIEKQLPLTLKAYTLLASITRRIAEEGGHFDKEGLQSSFSVLKQAFTKNYGIDFANELTQGLLNKKEHTTTARLINKQIDKNLRTYFAEIK